MSGDQKEVRRFLRVEQHERTVFDRHYGAFLRLVAFRTMEAVLGSAEVAVVKLTNYDILDGFEPDEQPKSWRREEVGFERFESLLVGAMAMTRVSFMGDLPVVFHLYEIDGAASIRIILRKEDRDRLRELLDWLDRIEESVHPLKGQILQVNPKGVSFLPPQSVSRDDVFLPADVLNELERGFLFLSRPDVVPPGLHHRAMLLTGLPGVGKTLACKWLAGWVSATVLWTTPQCLWEAGAQPLLELARTLSPTLLILEDLDLASGTRDGASPLGDLLAQLDGFGSLNGIGIVATTNHPEMLDHALNPRTRPGRFHLLIELKEMDGSTRRSFLEYLFERSEILPEPGQAVLGRLLRVTRGFTGAQVFGLIQDLELFWLWEIEKSQSPTLTGVLEAALNGRPSITRHMGFDLGQEQEAPQALEAEPAGR